MKVLENTSGKNQEVRKLNDNDFRGDFWQGKETGNFNESYDLTLLTPLNEQTVLQAIEARYHGGIFYSWAGLPLVAVNPFNNVSELYEKTMVEKYKRGTSLKVKELPPHIFAVGQKAFCDLKRDLETRNQSIIVSGESGAGKTWTTRSLMRFITDITHTRPEEVFQVSRIEQRILNSSPILEAFGNATTTRNENSSRFGKYIQLQFDRKHNVVGATINTYLLEKTRVVHQAGGEKNFHIFEQMETARSEETSVSHSFYHFPALQVTREAMRNIGIDDQLQHGIFEVLRGILALCDVHFTSPTQTSGDTCCFQDFDKVSEACRLLGIEEGRLQQCFVSRRITTGSTNEQFMKPCSVAECGERKDCMIKLIYSSLFDWIVDFINASISAPRDSKYSFIGLLDIYGFENFDINSLEQLCINYANEKLQQHFVYHFMKRQQDDYRKEGIEWSFQDFVDNRPCLDLIEGKMSIFSLMNEECRLKRDLDTQSFSCRLDSSLAENCHFARPRFRSKDHEFTIHHFADNVCYKVQGLLRKNKDFVPPEVVEFLQRSTNRLIMKLFLKKSKSTIEENGEHEGRVATKHRQTTVTVAYKFKASLDSLMSTLRSTNVHYIRCIKPNSKCEPGIFDRKMVLSQLNACGVVETISISAAGFPIRLSHHEFLRRYSLLLRYYAPLTPTHVTRHQVYPSSKSPGSPQFPAGDRRRRRSLRRTRRSCYDHTKFICQSILEVAQCYDDEGKENLASKECTGVKVGRTKIFLQDEEMEKLESIRNRCLAESVLTIQKCWRRYRKRTERKKTSAAVAIQSVLRGWLARKKFYKVRQAATVIQRCARHYIRKKRLKQLYQTVKDQIMPTAELSSDIPESTVEPSQYGLVAKSSQRDLTYSFDTPLTVCGFDLLKAQNNSARPGASACTYDAKTTTFDRTSGSPTPLDFMSILACFSQHKRFCERTNAWNNLDTAIQFINRSSKIASRRHIETIPIAFHCRGTPLPYANTRPTRGCDINTGLADIGELYHDTLYFEDLD